MVESLNLLCNQCADDLGKRREIFPPYFLGSISLTIICDGCGPTEVNHSGYCISEGCRKKHGMLFKKPLHSD